MENKQVSRREFLKIAGIAGATISNALAPGTTVTAKLQPIK